jgi:DNA mismatch repair protein MutL
MSTATLPTIRQLPPGVVNKIAAGEVIERPASVVKELLENAVDAGAQRIDVTVGQGGLDLVRISDDGCGIAADELLLAVASHATSKIRDADDLFRVDSLGFRGEALASIAEVSHFRLRSRPQGAAAGAELDVRGGQITGPTPCGCPVGTLVEVRNLFFNVPVRRKFLRSTQTEMGHVTEAFTRLALALPGIHFTLRHNERTVYDLPPAADVRTRVAEFFGRELADALIEVESMDRDVKLSGFVAMPSQSRANVRMQYLFLNGRAIRDRALQHALGESYRGLLLTGRYPICFLRIEMPADLVDVNVHPTKLEVRFQDGGQIYAQLLGTLRTRFLSTDLTARGVAPSSAPQDGPAAALDAEKAAQLRQELVGWAKGELGLAPGVGAAEPPLGEPAIDWRGAALGTRPLELVTLDDAAVAAPGRRLPTPAVPTPTSAAANSAAWRGPAPAVQMHNRYLVAEVEEGVMVIDQHALHERVLYEQFRERVLAGELEAQQLLAPEPVPLTAAELAAAIEAADTLAQLGVRVEAFGGDTLLVRSLPAMLGSIDPAELARELVTRLMDCGPAPQRRDLLDHLLHTLACKAAIKAGDPLAPDEVEALLAQRHLAQDAHHCPHGRPTALVFTRQELDRQFKRT